MKSNSKEQISFKFFDRDVSWLSFNERVLNEASRDTVPLMERIRFLSIYSSNLDEFYRVRMPTLLALNKLSDEEETVKSEKLLEEINATILNQLKYFGGIIKGQILSCLRSENICLLYNEPIPDAIIDLLKQYFIVSVASFIQIIDVTKNVAFFPENNKLYFVVTTSSHNDEKKNYIVNIPSDVLSRFFTLSHQHIQYIVFLDDIVRLNLPVLFKGQAISSYSFKITRNAELDLEDEFTGNLARKIERKIHQRDFGLATRFLYEPGLPHDIMQLLKKKLNLKGASFIAGGSYHNLKDLATLPLNDFKFHYEPWPKSSLKIDNQESLFDQVKKQDILIHPPYHSYDVVLRFFNEASIDPSVDTIYITLYRVASDSRIVNALISAAKNGKRVVVFVELKARFDEANNIKWSKRMKKAGVRIIESIPGLKVHAKLALVKRRIGKRIELLGLLSTGNFNESTARFYTDHLLMTSDKRLLCEAELLFKILKKRKRKIDHDSRIFKHLFIGQFNLQESFIYLIEREIQHAKKGLPASIIIKFNNLEDRVLISKLYEASNAGVQISMIVRSICCLIPGVDGMSKNITIRRIVDRYLEHGRIFIFCNNNDPDVFLGSADWMNRNIYRRIEVCFPVYDPALKSELIEIVNLQLKDAVQGVVIDELCNNVILKSNDLVNETQSQKAIAYTLLHK